MPSLLEKKYNVAKLAVAALSARRVKYGDTAGKMIPRYGQSVSKRKRVRTRLDSSKETNEMYSSGW